MAKKKFIRKGKTFVEVGGVKFTKKYIQDPSGFRLMTQIPKGVQKRERKKPVYHPPRRRKVTAIRTLEGLGAGFVAGLGTGGFAGMLVGVPLGAYAGNIIGKKETGQPIIPKKTKKTFRKFFHIKRPYHKKKK